MNNKKTARWDIAAMLAVCLALVACAPTKTQKVESYLPTAVPTAYMVFYDKNSVIAADSEQMLMEVAAAMLTSKNIMANINAFRGPDEVSNQDTLRAATVMKFLVDHGVDPSRTFANPMGLAEPVGTEDDGNARRRVEIFISPLTAAPK